MKQLVSIQAQDKIEQNCISFVNKNKLELQQEVVYLSINGMRCIKAIKG